MERGCFDGFLNLLALDNSVMQAGAELAETVEACMQEELVDAEDLFDREFNFDDSA